MRVLIVSTEFPPGPGGIGTHAFELARHLTRRGWEVSVLAAQDYASRVEADAFNRAQPFAIEPWRVGPLGPLRPALRLAVLLRSVARRDPDVLVASGGRAVVLSAVARGRHRIPLVAIGHGTEFGRRGGGMAALRRAAFRRAAAVVCVSEHTRRLMHEFGVHPPSESVIPNGADAERFRVLPDAAAALRRRLGLPDGHLFVTVGHVTLRKAQDVVVRALPRVVASVSDAHYLIVGLPLLADAMREIAAAEGVSDRVHLLGRVDGERLVEILNASDLFVMTSRRTDAGDVEGYGIAVVEAALCEKPAVVAAGSGLSEAIVEGETGVSVPPEDPAATARAIVALLQDDARRRTMGQRARARALSEQTWARRVEAYDELLRRVVSAEERDPNVRRAVSPIS